MDRRVRVIRYLYWGTKMNVKMNVRRTKRQFITNEKIDLVYEDAIVLGRHRYATNIASTGTSSGCAILAVFLILDTLIQDSIAF
jgi:hypothetical protein